jgi:hypothetical protein
MKIISHSDQYQIYSDDLKTFDKLPAATYKVEFDPMSGFSLVKIDNFETVEEKIYGNHEEKIAKVLTSYERFNRSMGVILSGDKGMGKSLFVQLLAKQAVDKGMPVIMVTKAYKGIADFIERIDQECLVIFDEFEKIFTINGENGESQNALLGLFDGTSQKKRMYAITVNKLYQVSEFIVSRTGRFHYHLRFDYPTPDEIVVYLRDKLEEEYYQQINHVTAFASRIKLNYDSLRAIAFELNQGYSFGSAIADLNILTLDDQRYNVSVTFSNGKTSTVRNQNMNLFEDAVQVDGYIDNDQWYELTFNSANIETRMGEMFVAGQHVKVEFGNQQEMKEKGITVSSIMMTQHKDAGVNYKLAL